MGGRQNLETIMGLVTYGGNAENDAMEAITATKSGNFELADKKIVDVGKSLVHAHHSQTRMLTEETKGNDM